MKIFYSSKFAREYKRLPIDVKQQAEKKEKSFRKNPVDPTLKTHKLAGRLKDYWAFSIDYKYRIIFEFKSKQVIHFHSVGTHDVYRQ